ncbi:LAMI_0H07404g1_1 [Lachancea mirantina]|uniref:LAMI_0H07404g1_1 n=1 Tax=Lachancea mirantina TaxID=1230905 RepID=A0A1G4KFT7_9SACH|nr:LAMI_0H07404g1_1 [Lachancea mirantina]
MEWAVRIARRKAYYIQGGSRSIIESLNKYNEAISEGQEKINTVCQRSLVWLDNEMHRFYQKKELSGQNDRISGEQGRKSEIGLELHRQDDITDTKTRSPAGPSVFENGNRTHESAVPESNAVEEEIDINGRRTQSPVTEYDVVDEKGDDNDDRKCDETKENLENYSTRPSENPWSPYKKSESTYAGTENGSRSGTHSTGNVESKYRENVKSQQLQTTSRQESPQPHESEKGGQSKDVANPTLSKPVPGYGTDRSRGNTQITTTKSQRRPDMFVPLPSKDPLVVFHKNRESITIDTNPLEAGTRRISATNLHFKTSPSLPKAKAAQTSPRSNVFDRLTSTSTKSFEKKARSRSPRRDIQLKVDHSRGSTNTLNRRSPAKSIDDSNQEIQETLKTIFSTEIPKLSIPTSKLTENSEKSHRVRQDGKRTSLIPKLSGKTMVGSPLLHRNKSPRSKLVLSSPDHFKTLPAHHFVGESPANPRKTATKPLSTFRSRESIFERKVSFDNGSDNFVGADKHSISRIQKDLKTSAKDREKRNFAHSLTADTPLQESDSNPTGTQVRKRIKVSNDRLTKFQLLPQGPSEKQDVKKKLDKRLSEVMRTQKELQKRKQEQRLQRRKSQIEHDVKKRRTKILSGSTRTNRLLTQVGAQNDNVAPFVNGGVFLHDVNTTDHREFINHSMNEDFAGDDLTLPEILSDSDAEDIQVLASWAENPQLCEQLLAQQNWKPESIFGPIPPLHIDEIFQISRLSKLKSRQSTNQASPGHFGEVRKL